MRLLVTGATGFLGKRTLFAMMNEDRIDEIFVISRSKKTHPSPKVTVVKGDLTDPSCMQQLKGNFDAVVHIAGLYDFASNYSDNYLNNVVATSHILAWCKAQKSTPHMHFVSTYAVGAGNWDYHEPEGPVKNLPPEDRAYPYSKALAENTVIESGLPYTIYRPGIIVGDSVKGQFENLNGPYYIISLLSQLRKVGVLSRLPMLPIPAKKEGYLPLVPVDTVASVLSQATLNAKKHQGKCYGIYKSGSVNCGKFFEYVIQHYNLSMKIMFVGTGHPLLLKVQQHLTQIPPEVFLYANEVPDLHNNQYLSDFSGIEIPQFEDYKDAFFSGYDAMNGEF